MEYTLFHTSRDFVDTHVPLLEAMKAKDEQAAVKLLQDHICGATNRIIPKHGKDDSEPDKI